VRRAADRTLKQTRDVALKYGIGLQPDRVAVALGFGEFVQVREGERGVTPEETALNRAAIALDDRPQHRAPVIRAVDIARAQGASGSEYGQPRRPTARPNPQEFGSPMAIWNFRSAKALASASSIAGPPATRQLKYWCHRRCYASLGSSRFDKCPVEPGKLQISELDIHKIL
jgi:hypothetical protein